MFIGAAEVAEARQRQFEANREFCSFARGPALVFLRLLL
jgi:hypothetical protein